MKTYQAQYDPLKNKGVYGISLVENPAMEGLFIALSKDEPIQLKTVNEEQRILMGLVLEPNKPIYRNQNGEEFNIVFNEQTIKELSYGFFKNNNHSNSTIEHDIDKNIQGVTFTESWIVENPKIDKSTNFGFEYPKGSWLAVMKVDDDKIWNDYVKTGKVQGFSIDAMLSLEEVKLSKNQTTSGIDIWFKDAMITKGCNVQTLEGKNLNDGKYELMTNIEIEVKNGIVINLKESMNKQETLLEKILMALTPTKKIELGSAMLADGSLKIEWEGDALSEGLSVWVTADDGTKVPVPIGEHPLEDGTILIVEVEGIAKEIKQPEAPAEETPAPAQDMSDAGKAESKMVEEVSNAIKSVLIKYNEQEAVIVDLKAELSELKTQIIELGKQPSERKIVNTTTKVEFAQRGKFSDLLNKLNN